jgi:Na+-translocating ferredoxin:NAD+ oxidoreductase subunit B
MNVATRALDRLDALARELNDALPQTQCTRCGYPDCAAYAEAIARDGAAINQCPPGGAEGIDRLAAITGRPAPPLNPVNGAEAPRLLAVIDEAWCIGCTLCLKACPTDAILGGSKAMHTVIDAECTGCELCLPACPVDCISLVPISGERTGWQAWSTPQAQVARERYQWHRERLQRESEEQTQPDLAPASGKRSVIDAALARARATRRV